MHRHSHSLSRAARCALSVAACTLGVGATADTLNAAEALRAAIQSELAPLKVTLTEQAKAVASGLVEDALAGFACRLGPRGAQQAASARPAPSAPGS